MHHLDLHDFSHLRQLLHRHFCIIYVNFGLYIFEYWLKKWPIRKPISKLTKKQIMETFARKIGIGVFRKMPYFRYIPNLKMQDISPHTVLALLCIRLLQYMHYCAFCHLQYMHYCACMCVCVCPVGRLIIYEKQVLLPALNILTVGVNFERE